MMKKIYLILFAFALTAVSCERVVVIDLNEASPKLVVEGRIVLDSVAVVVLRETGSYFVPDSQPGVTDAQVILHDDAGHFDTLQHDQNGVYKGSTLLGEEETTYYLDILHD